MKLLTLNDFELLKKKILKAINFDEFVEWRKENVLHELYEGNYNLDTFESTLGAIYKEHHHIFADKVHELANSGIITNEELHFFFKNVYKDGHDPYGEFIL